MATKRVTLLVCISIFISVTAIIVSTSSTTFSRYEDDNDSSFSSSLPSSTQKKNFKNWRNSTNPIEDDTTVNSTWDDVNLFSSKECGNYKCFFPSKTNPEEVGYLVARETDRMYDRMMHGWNIAKQIEKLEHNNNAQRHFYLTSPMLKEVTEDDEKLRKRLNRKLPKRRSMTTGGVKKPAANVFVFQKVKRAAPSDHTILRCQQKWIGDSIMSVFKILGGNKRNNNNHPLSIISTTTRADTFFNEINDLIILIQHSKPELVQDFQILVDNQGLIYHFDLDRAIKHPSEEDLHICICNLRKMSILIRQFFSEQQQNASSSSSSLHHQKEPASKIFSIETSNEERLELLSTKSRFENISECQNDWNS